MRVVPMDNRGLSPPEPLLRILGVCEALEPGDRIEAQMDRRPIFLFPELEDRELLYDCVERPDGSFFLTIERPS